MPTASTVQPRAHITEGERVTNSHVSISSVVPASPLSHNTVHRKFMICFFIGLVETNYSSF